MTPYTQHHNKVVETDLRFNHVMALSLDPRTQHKHGVIRCIISREGDVAVGGYVDRSRLHRATMTPLECFEMSELVIEGEVEILEELVPEGFECIGFEDPDIWVDEQTDLLHLYFTIPVINHVTGEARIYLGHAMGRDVDSLRMTWPVLEPDAIGGAKEVSIAPLNSKGLRYNLVESGVTENGTGYSVVRIAVARDMSQGWAFGDIAFHPKHDGAPWIAGHASPGPLLPQGFLDLGQHRRLGIMNGREGDRIKNGQTQYGLFSVGLFVYDFENGRIEWVSPEPLIRDSEARTITFASQFVLTEEGKGILYAHVDDSFVRSYGLDSRVIAQLVPEQFFK